MRGHRIGWRGTLAERLEQRVEPEPNSGCWLWMGPVNSSGYGTISYNGKIMGVHRAAYLDRYELIPDGMTLDHLCRVRRCVNPNHLQPATLKENVLRGLSPAAMQAKRTHCIRGHALLADNLRIDDAGARQCRICDNIRARERRRRKR